MDIHGPVLSRMEYSAECTPVDNQQPFERKRPDHIPELGSNDVREVGVRCPDCHCRHCPTRTTRHTQTMTIRERVCRHCGRLFYSRETIVQ